MVLKMGRNFQWLIMSVEKDDIQIIESESLRN